MDALPLVLLAAAALASLFLLFVAWRILIWIAERLIAIDRAIFRPRARPRPAPLDLPSERQLGLTLSFDYVDGDGDTSHRTARIDRAYREAGRRFIYLDGVCFTAHATRTFRTDRMSNVLRLDTGEVIDDPTSTFTRLIDP